MAVHSKKTSSKDEDLEKDGELIDDEPEPESADDEEEEEALVPEDTEDAQEPEAPVHRSSWDGTGTRQKSSLMFAALLFGVPLALILIIEIVSRGCGG